MNKLGLALALASVGCPGKKHDDPPAPTPSPVVAPSSAPTTQPQLPPPTPVLPAVAPDVPNALSCALVLPQPVRDTYFHGLDVHSLPTSGPASAECEIAMSNGRAMVSATCGDEAPDAMEAVITLRVERMHGKRMSVGRGGVLLTNEAGNQAIVWDDDSNCHVRFQVPRSIDVVALAKTVLAVLPVK